MPHYGEDEKYWDMQKPTTSRSTKYLTLYIYILLHTENALLLWATQTWWKERQHTLTNPSTHSTCCHSGLIFISSCNQTFRLQGSLGQRKKLPKATRPSLISRRKGCVLNGLKASSVNYLSAFESFSSSLSGQPMTNRSVRLCHPAFKLLFS